MRSPDGPEGSLSGGYRDQLAAATARIEALEQEIATLAGENRALLAQLSVPGALAQIDADQLPPEARRRVIQRRIRAIKRELRASMNVRRYAASAILAVTAAAAFVIMAAESVASWPLAIATLCMGAVARSLVSQWPGFDELEDRRRKLAALKSQLDQLRTHRHRARDDESAHEPAALPATTEG